MGRRILAILTAAVIALVGAVLVLVYARGADARAVAAASPTKVYVSNTVVPAGTSLRDAVRLGQVVQTDVAARAKPLGALEKVDEDNSDLVALTDVQPGQYVLAAAFGDTPVGEKKLQIDPGKLAVSVQLQDPARVGNFVTPGSYLTIFMTYQETPSGGAGDGADASTGIQKTSVLLDNVKVIAMGDASLTPVQTTDGDGAEAQSASFLVTLQVTPEDAVRLVHAINGRTLYAALRGSELKISPTLEADDLNISKVAAQ
ncbi:Flp pilus assembly protein CpaB [Phycicoccus sp. MAQZ13P-2]|uniref:Flp pilus assembly protein CpaB n=1 Tax=Phycicoccus mangrovi TaxID=2840470 RepID=UPI001C006B47|nr:RcpC/CpaB family pilus assembly protein [Phycicoccus mangrovi]MBT9255906.1 Flp pilus assembly protein CpaB [Phycicoccus mangrovi]MBT9274500.1 Flp pilus assembly protein CpaB [Phycicoccus mangrovi]